MCDQLCSERRIGEGLDAIKVTKSTFADIGRQALLLRHYRKKLLLLRSLAAAFFRRDG